MGVSFGRNEVVEFHYATVLTTGVQAIVPVYGTAAADKVKRVKITDLKASVGGTARSIRLSGQGGPNKDIQFNLPADSTHNFTWELPYPLTAISSTGEDRAIFASASGADVDVVISGYIDVFT